MKFFKHYVDAHESKSLQEMYEHFGHAGPNCYWILVELCAKELEVKGEQTLSPLDCVFNFHATTLRQKFRLSSTKIERWLNLGSTENLFSYTKDGSSIKIAIPKLLECLDRDSKRPRKKREQAAQNSGLEEDKEKDTDKDKEVEMGKTPPARMTLFEVNPLLKGDSTLDEVLQYISGKTQERWIRRYQNPTWLKRVLSTAVSHHQTKAEQNGETIQDWGLKLNTWLSREKNPPGGRGNLDINFDAAEESA